MTTTIQIEPALDDDLARLAALQGTDPGLFVLAVHSFVEAWLRRRVRVDEYEEATFYAYVDAFLNKIVKQHGGWMQSFSILRDLKGAHKSTNAVRHEFAALDVEQARLATRHLQRFCELAHIPPSAGLERLEAYLQAWDERKPVGELKAELDALKQQIGRSAAEVREKSQRLAAYEGLEAAVSDLAERLKAQDARVAELEKIKGAKDAKVDELRKERAALAEELRNARRQAEAYTAEREYVDRLVRLTSYTRTRADYERSITRLSQEQKKVLERINFNEDFLIKGAAGTGKTLVLIKAIEKALGGQVDQRSLDLPEINGTVALLTYTNTLVKYDQYVAGLLSGGDPAGRIATADSFLAERFAELDAELQIDYGRAQALAAQFPVAGLNAKELATEAETFIWGNDVSREEYLDAGLERRGMKRPLSKDQRQAVWTAVEAMEEAMAGDNLWSRNRAALRLARAVADTPAITRTDYIFIDEAQDLPAAVLKALKACAGRAVILAGDADQSIYQPGFSFKRAGLDIGGRTRILRTNFRNTVQVHDFAERYRQRSGGADSENDPEAFRDGPVPELFQAADLEGMYSLLIQRLRLFLNTLEYAAENLCVVLPRDDDLQKLAAHLATAGLAAVDLRDKAFDFKEGGAIRLTTMHSAKGLDFPVVCLFIPQYHVINANLDPDTTDRMARNLLYVALTRAMDHLNVFLREGTENPAICDLVNCFAESVQPEAANP